MRPFRFVLHMKEYGWEPTVVTIDAPGQVLTEKEAELLKGIEVVRIKPPYDRSVTAESQLGLAPVWNKTRKKGPNPIDRMLNGMDRLFPIDSWLILFWMKYRQIEETILRVQPDVLWSTGDPWSGLVMGEKISRQFNIPWVADFRDPWTLCEVRSEGKSPLTQAVDRRYENKILNTADKVLFQARQTEEKYRAYYPQIRSKATTIYNSYDPLVLDDPVDLNSASPLAISKGNDLHLGFFGRFRAMSPAKLIMDVLESAHRRHGPIAGRIKVHPFGPLNLTDENLAIEHGIADQFIPADAVPLEKSVSALNQFDILLLSTDTRRNEIIPAKLLEYLAAARPVLSMSRNPEVAEILERTGAGVQVDSNELDTVADLLVDCVKAKDEKRRMPIPFELNPEAVQRFDARTTTEELATLFDSIVGVRSYGS